jgi:TPR repeat protein
MSNSAKAKADICCANCSIAEAEVDEVKMEECDSKLLHSCRDKCHGREEHQEQHDDKCKKRVEELHNDDLFTQPDGSHLGECPLCFLPMPLRAEESTFYACCSKLICDGCVHANYLKNGNFNCPFCREPPPDAEEFDKRMMKRVKANDPAALRQMGTERYYKGDYDGAVKYWTKAAKLGDEMAHNKLGYMYWKGEGVERDKEKEVYHLEKAAIGGHPTARHSLGCYEDKNGNTDRAVKHFIINASLGDKDSMKELWKHYSAGNITKEELEATLRTHQAAVDEMKSPEREAAKAWRKACFTLLREGESG